MIAFLSTFTSVYTLVWLAGAVFGHWAKLPLAKTIKAELNPLYLPAVVVGHVATAMLIHNPWNVWHLIGTACGIANYWLFRDDDDDRWKRRRKKLAEKIARRGSRLVVVSAGASS